jgi:hypothetical protein
MRPKPSTSDQRDLAVAQDDGFVVIFSNETLDVES